MCTWSRRIGLAYGLRRKAREDTQAGFSVSCFPTSLLLYFPSGQPLVIQPSDLPPGNRYFILKSQLVWEEALGRCLGFKPHTDPSFTSGSAGSCPCVLGTRSSRVKSNVTCIGVSKLSTDPNSQITSFSPEGGENFQF